MSTARFARNTVLSVLWLLAWGVIILNLYLQSVFSRVEPTSTTESLKKEQASGSSGVNGADIAKQSTQTTGAVGTSGGAAGTEAGASPSAKNVLVSAFTNPNNISNGATICAAVIICLIVLNSSIDNGYRSKSVMWLSVAAAISSGLMAGLSYNWLVNVVGGCSGAAIWAEPYVSAGCFCSFWKVQMLLGLIAAIMCVFLIGTNFLLRNHRYVKESKREEEAKVKEAVWRERQKELEERFQLPRQDFMNYQPWMSRRNKYGARDQNGQQESTAPQAE